jgi:hypothetical protein
MHLLIGTMRVAVATHTSLMKSLPFCAGGGGGGGGGGSLHVLAMDARTGRVQ